MKRAKRFAIAALAIISTCISLCVAQQNQTVVTTTAEPVETKQPTRRQHHRSNQHSGHSRSH